MFKKRRIISVGGHPKNNLGHDSEKTLGHNTRIFQKHKSSKCPTQKFQKSSK